MQNKYRYIFFIITLIFSQVTLFAQTKETIRKHVEYLASDALEGRLPCTTGDSLAANYIKKHLESKKVNPFESGFYQYFGIDIGVKITPTNRLTIGNTSLNLFEDFEPVNVTAEGNYQSELINIPFDSLISGSLSLESQHKWIAVEIGNYNPSVREYMRWATNASKENIKGIVFIVNSLGNERKSNPIYYSSQNNQLIRTQYKGSNKLFVKNDKGDISKITFCRGVFRVPIPLLMITKKSYEVIIASSRLSEQSKITINTTIEVNPITCKTQNVLGYIKGTERPDQYIIIGAHFDHLGYGGYETSSREPNRIEIHYGADDNASGTAAVLGLVTRLSNNPLPVSVVFALFASEEMGLLGSQHLVQNLPVEKNNIMAMLNYDMVGRMQENLLSIGGVGTADAFSTIIDTLKTQLQIRKSPYGTGPSDHASFNSEGIPVLYFSTGVHIDYHTPDDIASNINYQGIMSVIDYSELLLRAISMPQSDLTYRQTEPQQLSHATRNSLKVSLGIMPDVTGGDNTGLTIMGVTAGGAADRAELKKGDKIVNIDGTPIQNIYDYMEKLQHIAPNQISNITIERDKKQKVVLIKF